MVVELGADEEVVDDGRVDDGELRPQRDQDRALHEQREGREGAVVGRLGATAAVVPLPPHGARGGGEVGEDALGPHSLEVLRVGHDLMMKEGETYQTFYRVTIQVVP